MKRILIFTLSFLLIGISWLPVAEAACTNTTNLALCKPALSDTGWGTNLNNNFDLIDARFNALGGITTPAESWIGPSSTTGLYFKAGNVGIGTTSPSEKLDVRSNYSKADTTSQPIVFFGSNETSNPLGLVINHSYYGSRYHVTLVATVRGLSGNDIDINGDDSGAGMTVQYQGKVGINKSNPGYLLDMETSGGGYYSTADHLWHSGSSRRWKQDVKTIANPLGILRALKGMGVRFTWDQDHGGYPGIGFIAEEVGQFIPEIVSYDGDNPQFARGMNYSGLIPVLTEAVNVLFDALVEKGILADVAPAHIQVPAKRMMSAATAMPVAPTELKRP